MKTERIGLPWVMHMRKKAAFLSVVGCVLASLCLIFVQLFPGRAAPVSGRAGAAVLILDAGHGGEDGGAVSLSGVAESGINLAIVKKLDGLAGLYGVPAVLTRAEDCSLADESAATLREKKRSDLQNRVALVNGIPNACLLSIHQNNFSSRSVSGAQVFYRDTDESARWAALTQEALRCAVNPENDRTAAVIPDSVYLLKNITCPAILVECGFLSNPTEEQKLLDEGYQSRLAAAIFSGYLFFFTGEIGI